MFGQTIDEVCELEGVSFDVGDLYERTQIAKMTGWTLEYIDGLGLIDREALLQISSAEREMMKGKHGV